MFDVAMASEIEMIRCLFDIDSTSARLKDRMPSLASHLY